MIWRAPTPTPTREWKRTYIHLHQASVDRSPGKNRLLFRTQTYLDEQTQTLQCVATKRQTRGGGVLASRFFQTLPLTCSQSSLVGTSTTARTPLASPGSAAFRRRTFCSSGSANAAVFPEPVLARTCLVWFGLFGSIRERVKSNRQFKSLLLLCVVCVFFFVVVLLSEHQREGLTMQTSAKNDPGGCRNPHMYTLTRETIEATWLVVLLDVRSRKR